MKQKDSVLFRGLTDDQFNRLLTRPEFSENFYPKDSYIFQQGEVPEQIFVLLQGGVQVEAIGENGRRTILNRFTEPGTMFAEVYAYIDHRGYDYSCRATVDTRTLCIRKELLMQDTDDPAVRILLFNMLTILSQKAYELNQKLRIIMEMTLRQKILQYLNQHADENGQVSLSFNREEMADYLGTARPSLSRELNSMEQEGLILVHRNSIQLLDP